jgi:TetR/AcrR family transcriptional repressor of nem operon
MRVTSSTFTAHRAAILRAAGRLFRRRGLEGVGVAEISRAAGLTHGAFYGHYRNKTELAAEAMAAELAEAAVAWRRRSEAARAAGQCPLALIVERYLSERHRDAVEDGCALAALGPELTRADPPLPEALRHGIDALIAVLVDEIALARPALPPDACRDAALAMLAAMNGGLILARALAASPDASRAVLRSSAELALRALPPA